MPGADPLDLLAELRTALSGIGPALLPRAAESANPHARPEVPQPGHPEPPSEVAKNVALVVETSGSTGAPKRVALSSGALLASAAGTQSALGSAGQWLLSLPTHYIAGVQVLVRSITAEVDPVVLPPGAFDVDAFVEATAGFRPRVARFTSLVPTQLHRLVEAAEGDRSTRDALRSFDGILVGGQATPSALRDRSLELGIRLIGTYGSSETAGGCVYDGAPIGTTRVEVVDGQVEIAGPTLAEGYLADPAATDAAFAVRDGLRWYRTGDAGDVTDGILRITGRLDAVIISGGEKVSLDRIEDIARGIPGLHDAVAVSAPDPEWGATPVVFTAADPAIPRESALREALIGSLGRVASRAVLVHLQALPTLPSGKPDRRALAESAAVTRRP